MVGRLCEATSPFKIRGSSFVPPPDVDASVVCMENRPKALGVEVSLDSLEFVLRQVFGQRRKTLRNSVRSLGEKGEEILLESGLDGSKRAQELTIDEWCILTKVWQSKGLRGISGDKKKKKDSLFNLND